MWRGGEFFCGAGQPNVVTRIKCGDPCINFGVAISSRGDAPPPPNTPPPSPSGSWELPLQLLGNGQMASCTVFRGQVLLLGEWGLLLVMSTVVRRSILFMTIPFMGLMD